MKELRELAEFVESFRLKGVGEEVIKAAKYCVLDTVGQALGAKDNPMIREIAKVYALCDGECSGRLVSFWGNEKKVPLRQAVFLNAMMGHTLELDDVHTNSKTHIGTVVIPAAWSLAEYLGKSGRDLLEAVICGYETMARIGMGFGVSSHRNRGWHVTGTAGGFGAAAACAKLLDFTSEQIVGAFGLAGTQACSTWAFLSDGATNKVLHPGRAAANGLESCLLVLGGMRGSSYILDAKDGGIFPMMSDEYDYALVSAGLGKVYELLRMDKKPYPCCRSTHCAIDAGIELREQEKLQWERIRKVEIKTYLVGLKQCGLAESSREPKLPTEAKFSTPYTAACALMYGKVGLEDFEPAAIARPQVRELMRKIKVTEDEELTGRYPSHWGCRMEVEMEDGRIFRKEIQDASGSADAPLTAKQILAKVKSCCAAYDGQWVEGVFEEILNLEELETIPELVWP